MLKYNMSEKYDLKWKTFPDHMLGVFKDLGENGHFTDVTLVSDDQISTLAHKVVLSACSPVLKALLVNHPHSNPLLFLKGIKQTELQAILKFMYFGETQIYEERINDFLSVAKDLEVKEISEEEAETGEYVDENNEEIPQQNENVADIPDNQEPKIKRESAEVYSKAVSKVEQRNTSVKEGATLNCLECDATFTTTNGLKLHTKNKHEGVTYPCTECDFKASQKVQLKSHINIKHRGIRFDCEKCEHQTTTKASLKIHVQSVHEGIRFPCDKCEYKAKEKVSFFQNHDVGSNSLIQAGLKEHIQLVLEERGNCPSCNYKAKQKAICRHIYFITLFA